jgi:hypothetical protein
MGQPGQQQLPGGQMPPQDPNRPPQPSMPSDQPRQK